MKTVDTKFDESIDGSTPIMPGTYPGNVVSFTTKTFDNGSMVFNMSFKIAESVKNLNIPKQYKNNNGEYATITDDSGNEVEISAAYMEGKTFYANGVWLTPSPEKGQGWKNRKYLEAMTALGVDFPKDKDGLIELAEVEEEDVLGLPALVSLSEEEYTNRNGEEKTSFKVTSIDEWKDGDKLSTEELAEDVPF